MKKGILSVIVFLTCLQLDSQNLTVEQTIAYVNNELSSIGATDIYGNKIDNHSYKLKLKNDGYLVLDFIHTTKNTIESKQVIHINDIDGVEVGKFSGAVVRVKCKLNNCCRNEDFIDNKTTSTNELMFKVPYSRTGERIKNALVHLISEAKKTYKTEDPFAPENSQSKLKTTNADN